MAASVTEEQWDAVRESVRRTLERYCELVASIPNPGTKVTAEWSVADTTAHVTTIGFFNTMLLEAAEVPFLRMFAHMVNEMLIHGSDIARAVKVPWAMPPEDAALFFDLFYTGLASGDSGRPLAGSKRPLKRRIAVEFRSSYTIPVTFVVRDGKLTSEPAGPGADATVRFDPATLNMMMFGRISKLRAVLTGKIVISGRRPWLMPALLRTVRLPS